MIKVFLFHSEKPLLAFVHRCSNGWRDTRLPKWAKLPAGVRVEERAAGTYDYIGWQDSSQGTNVRRYYEEQGIEVIDMGVETYMEL